MDIQTYDAIYKNLNSVDDIKKIHNDYKIQKSVLFVILNQKMVRQTKDRFYKIQSEAENITRLWKTGESIVHIANLLDFPPVLVASLIVQSQGASKKAFRRLLKDMSGVKNKRLRIELMEAVNRDFVYAPGAHENQSYRARIGEDIIRKWLLERGIEFTTEAEACKKENRKTPDFVIMSPLEENGRKISWIDSKASFGDEIEHKRYIKKQFLDYMELFGSGMVVYWYGFVDSIIKMEPGVLVKDSTYFREFKSEIAKIFNYERI